MDTFCVLPWVGREIHWTQRQTHCCLLPPNYDIDQIKKDMLDNKKPAACQKCWNLEAENIKSDRQVKNSALDFFWDRDLTFIKQDAIDNKLNDILMLKLITSFTCNATCVSCSSGASSSWSKLDHQADPTVPLKKYKSINLVEIKKQVDFSKLKLLSLIGGEPLYEKKNFELLQYMIDLGNTNVFLSLVTNGSVKLTSTQKNILSKFKNINFSVSIDGTESVFEYLRFPLKWNDLINNLNFFRQVTDNISSNYTLSNLNILQHNDTVQWFVDNKINYSINPVYRPAWLQPRALSRDIKDVLKNTIGKTEYNAFIGPIHTDQDQHNFESMLKNVQRQDTAKGISIKDYLPDLFKMF
jgi:organic radical activating enzyme